MKINYDRLNLPNKQYYWVQEIWPGVDPRATYSEQEATIARSLNNISYIEDGWDHGVVVAAFFIADRGGILQLLCVDSAEDLNAYLKMNESHIILPPENRKVYPMSSWDNGRETFMKMIARTKVRAEYEQKGKAQPSEKKLNEKSMKVLAKNLI